MHVCIHNSHLRVYFLFGPKPLPATILGYSNPKNGLQSKLSSAKYKKDFQEDISEKYFQKILFENVIWKISAFLFQSLCVK